jgi:hypothetical protein
MTPNLDMCQLSVNLLISLCGWHVGYDSPLPLVIMAVLDEEK